jgi:hypothetical protein
MSRNETPAAYDELSGLARDLLTLDQDSAYGRLVVEGSGNLPAEEKLRRAAPEQLFKSPPRQPRMAQLVMAGLWLWHDWLDESHRIAQQIETPDGSYWHAIMHRREGDFSNSKYWLARCRGHVTGDEIARRVMATPALAAVNAVASRGWDPFALVDLAHEVHDSPDDPRYGAVVSLQRIEWRVLFDHCVAGAR